MKEYIINNEKNSCFRDCLGCILEIDPKGVPNFAEEYGDEYIEGAREWLGRRFKKGIIYVPAKEFMEGVVKEGCRHNTLVGPGGYSIGYMEMVDNNCLCKHGGERRLHAVVCYNGGVLYDNGDDRHDEYDHLWGYFVIYDLNPCVIKRKNTPLKESKKKNKNKKGKRN